jgi:hypothetical protein
MSVSGLLKLCHPAHVCPLCGMTRAFVSISRGDLAQALEFNQCSIAVYGIFLANEVCVAAFMARRIGKFWLSRCAAVGVGGNMSTRKEVES